MSIVLTLMKGHIVVITNCDVAFHLPANTTTHFVNVLITP